MNKDEKREQRRKRLMDNKAYQTMNSLTRYMDRYYLDATHIPYDMGTCQLRQLPVFIGSIHFLNCHCLTEFKELAASFNRV